MPRKMRREMPLQALPPGAIVPICGVLIYNPAVGTVARSIYGHNSEPRQICRMPVIKAFIDLRDSAIG